MKKLIAVILLATGIWVLNGCYYDNPPEDQFTNIIVENISFAGDILPIFEASCSTANCHDGAHAEPDLTNEFAYTALIEGKYINMIFPEESPLFRSVENNSMPPAGVLSEYDKLLILGWIQKGAFND